MPKNLSSRILPPIILLLFISPACRFTASDQAPAPATPTQASPAPTETTLPSPPTSMNENQWVTTQAQGDGLQYRTFYSSAANTEVSYHIFLPQAYDEDAARHFPVIYWLHGTSGGAARLPYLAEFFQDAILAGEMPPVIVVFPNGLDHSMWCNSKDGAIPMETILMDELMPLIASTFRTIASREGRLIEGFSMGGYGAARLGLKYPDTFGAISMLAAGPLQQELTADVGPDFNTRTRATVLREIYGNDQQYFKEQSPWALAEQNAPNVAGRTIIRQVIGESDVTLEFNRLFDDHLTQLGIPHEFLVLPRVRHDLEKMYDTLGAEFYNFVFHENSIGAP